MKEWLIMFLLTDPFLVEADEYEGNILMKKSELFSWDIAFCVLNCFDDTKVCI